MLNIYIKTLLKIIMFPLKFAGNIMCFKLDYDLDRLEK
jgi:hypothetical protein